MLEPVRYECRSRSRRPLLRKSSSECARRAVSTSHLPHAVSRAELTLAIETWFVMWGWGYGKGGSIKTRGRGSVNTENESARHSDQLRTTFRIKYVAARL